MAVYKKGSVLYGVFDKKQVPQVPVFCCCHFEYLHVKLLKNNTVKGSLKS